MDVERLVAMANDIAAFFDSDPDHKVAVEGVRLHISRFWEKRMRATIIAHVAAGGAGLATTAREAVKEAGTDNAATRLITGAFDPVWRDFMGALRILQTWRPASPQAATETAGAPCSTTAHRPRTAGRYPGWRKRQRSKAFPCDERTVTGGFERRCAGRGRLSSRRPRRGIPFATVAGAAQVGPVLRGRRRPS